MQLLVPVVQRASTALAQAPPAALPASRAQLVIMGLAATLPLPALEPVLLGSIVRLDPATLASPCYAQQDFTAPRLHSRQPALLGPFVLRALLRLYPARMGLPVALQL